MSTPRTLRLTDGVRRVTLETLRGTFAALQASPTTRESDRLPALLVPGFTGSKEDFLSVLGLLARAGRTVTAIDMRGQYESPAAPDASGYTLAALAEDLAVTCGRPMHLLGHSFGGLVAQEAALAEPEALASLTLMSSGPGAISGDRAQALTWVLGELRSVPPGGLPAEVARIWETHMEPDAVADGVAPDVLAFLRERTLRNCPVGLMSMAEVLLRCPDRTARLAAVTAAADVGVLVVYGEDDDAWAPRVQEDMARRLGAQRVCIPRTGHSPAVEAPETVASALTAFWDAAEAALPASSRAQPPARLSPSASPSQGLRSGPAAAPSLQWDR